MSRTFVHPCLGRRGQTLFAQRVVCLHDTRLGYVVMLAICTINIVSLNHVHLLTAWNIVAVPCSADLEVPHSPPVHFWIGPDCILQASLIKRFASICLPLDCHERTKQNLSIDLWYRLLWRQSCWVSHLSLDGMSDCVMTSSWRIPHVTLLAWESPPWNSPFSQARRNPCRP